MSNAPRPGTPGPMGPAPPPTPRQIGNIVGLAAIAVVTFLSLLCIRLEAPGERAIVYGGRALGRLDNGVVIKSPIEFSDYIELKTYKYSKVYSAVLKDNRYVGGEVGIYEIGAEFAVSFEYELYDVDDATAKVIFGPINPLHSALSEDLGKTRVDPPWFTRTDAAVRHIESVASKYTVRLKNVSITSTEKIGRERVPAIRTAMLFMLDAGSPLRFSNVMTDRRDFENVVERMTRGDDQPLLGYVDRRIYEARRRRTIDR